MNFTPEELEYLNYVLTCTSSYTVAKAEQVTMPGVSHKRVAQKVKDLIHRMKS
jgi:hypothetical protein|tara:strand:- start:2559 stop:2717 length:159 start_codon:yes stop_codon:yes gene_type:complete